jgi:hypothetical protein
MFSCPIFEEFLDMKMNFVYHLLKTESLGSLHGHEFFVSIERAARQNGYN